MEPNKIKEFIENVEANCQDDEIKGTLVSFAKLAMDDERKADALQQFISNYSEDGVISPEIYEVPAYAIQDFYEDYIGNGGELDPSGNGIVGEPEEN